MAIHWEIILGFGSWALAAAIWLCWLTARSRRRESGDFQLSRDIPDDHWNVVALVRGAERYCWIFDDDAVDAAVRSAGKFAANPELSLTWRDAAIVAQKMRQQQIARNTAQG